MRASWLGAVFLAFVAFGIFAAWVWHRLGAGAPGGAAEQADGDRASPSHYVGSATCAGCHPNAYAAWRSSQHARAMQSATPSTVRGDFNRTEFVANGVHSTFFRRDGRFFVSTDGPDGALTEFEVTHTFGVEPLQQYLVPLPGGRLQALPIAWDTRPADHGGQHWFHLLSNATVDHRDELHWTKPAQNWNAMCADCHSTNVQSRYDAAADTFTTTFAEIGVGCESCHGPGSAHLSWTEVRSPTEPTRGLAVLLDERHGVDWRLGTGGTAVRHPERQSEREINVCAPCHSRRAQIADGYRAGEPFLDYYLPAMLVPELYYSDGQQRAEVYVWASFLQSKMYRAGVTCADCHEPHSQKLRAEGNALCIRCHSSSRYDSAAHHFHTPGTPASQCVNCHMPQTTYMVNDPRRDHSLRVPRPDRSRTLGVPSSCVTCHKEPADWITTAYQRQYGNQPKGIQTFAEAFRAAEFAAPNAGAVLAAIVADHDQPALVRASALERLARLADPAAARSGRMGATDPSPLVRLAAARLTGMLAPPERAAIATPLLRDPLRAVRIESARALAVVSNGLAPTDQAAWRRAADEYLGSLERNADRPDARVQLGMFFFDLGRADQAHAVFTKMRALAPDFVPAYINDADVYRAEGNEGAAEAVLTAGLEHSPRNASLHHALGLGYVRQQRPELALKALGEAARLAVEERRYVYVYAVALHSFGRTPDALRTLEAAAATWPTDRDILIALATVRRDAGQLNAARQAAAALVAAYPEDSEARALLNGLR